MTRRLPILLRRAWYGLNQTFRRRIAHTGCTPDQYTVLRNLEETGRGGLTQSELTRSMSSDPNTITALVRRMQASRLIERERDPRDRRVWRLRLTEQGRRRHRELRRMALELQAEVLGVLPEERRLEFLGELEIVADACRDASVVWTR